MDLNGHKLARTENSNNYKRGGVDINFNDFLVIGQWNWLTWINALLK